MKKLISILLVLSLALGLFAGGSTETQKEAAVAPAAATESPVQYADTVNIGFKGNIVLDAGDSWNATSNALKDCVYDGLTFYNQMTGELTMALAKSVEFTDASCLKVHVVLRDDIYFSNGNKVTTEDVEYSLKRATYSTISSVYADSEIVSEAEMYINLKTSCADFIGILGCGFCGIVDKASTEASADKVATIGCGPYVFDLDSYVVGSSIDLIRNENYYGEKAKTRRLHFECISSTAACGIALESGKIDFANLDQVQVDALEGVKGIATKSYPSTNFVYMIFNNFEGKPSDQEVALRRAIACAINKEEIMMAAGDFAGTTGVGFWDFRQDGYMASEKEFDVDLSFNQEKAKEYLKQSGVSSISVYVDTSKEWCKIAAQVIQEQLKQIGLSMEILETNKTGMTNISKRSSPENKNFKMAIWSNLFTTLPGAGYNYYEAGAAVNRAQINDPVVNETLKQLMIETDSAKRADLLRTIQKINHDEVDNILLWWRVQSYGYAEGVDGLIAGLGNNFNFKTIYKVVK